MLMSVLPDWGYTVHAATGGAKALKLTEKTRYSLIITDVWMDTRRDGIEMLAKLREGSGPNRRTPAIIITAYASRDDEGWQEVRTAMRYGAVDYLEKTPLNLDTLRPAVDRVLRPQNPAAGSARERMIGRSPAFLAMLDQINAVAPTTSKVLILGESGSGKELVARLVHELSGRTGAFCGINCAGVQDTLLQSELFGHVANAYTGALARRGLIRMADLGTVFLDEIGDASPEFQQSLLRVIQEKVVRPVGSDLDVEVDVRYVAGTNKNLAVEIEKERFRYDLLQRLNVWEIRVPPLRDRPGDIELLAGHFVAVYANEYNRDVAGLDSDAIDAICRYSWPGNVRELENAMSRAVIAAGGRVVTREDLVIPGDPAGAAGQAAAAVPAPVPEGGPAPPLLRWEEDERAQAEHAMNVCGGVVAQAARFIGINRRTLVRRLSRYGLDHLRRNPL
jgi:DNA-binding NtrC family response regulator